MENKIYFEREVRIGGGSLKVVIPPEICQYLNITEGTKIKFVADESKHGRFVGIWNQETQKVEE